jgi:hypothetical protein
MFSPVEIKQDYLVAHQKRRRFLNSLHFCDQALLLPLFGCPVAMVSSWNSLQRPPLMQSITAAQVF